MKQLLCDTYDIAYPGIASMDTDYRNGVVKVDLGAVKPMIALPFHPSNTYTIDELNANLGDILCTVEVEAAKISGKGEGSFPLTDKIKNGAFWVELWTW